MIPRPSSVFLSLAFATLLAGGPAAAGDVTWIDHEFRYAVDENSAQIYTKPDPFAATVLEGVLDEKSKAFGSPGDSQESTVTSTAGPDDVGLGLELKAGAGGGHLPEGARVHAYAEVSTTAGGVPEPYGVTLSGESKTQRVTSFSVRRFDVDEPGDYHFNATLTGSVQASEFSDMSFNGDGFPLWARSEYEWSGGATLYEIVENPEDSTDIQRTVLAEIPLEELLSAEGVSIARFVELRAETTEGVPVYYDLSVQINLSSLLENFSVFAEDWAAELPGSALATLGTETEPLEIQTTIDAVACESTFADVPCDHWALGFIETLYNSGISAGCGGDNFCPDAPVSRAQMAVFLERGINGSAFQPPAAVGIFGDVPASHWAANWIEQLAQDGITSGCGSGNYCPETAVTRAQMAVFLEKALNGSAYSPPAGSGIFSDVPIGHWAIDWIEQLASDSITSGCGGGKYCPSASVTRAQMAVFLVRAFNLQ